MSAFAGLAQLEDGTPRHDLTPMGEKALQYLAQIEQTGLAIDQSHHVHTERILQLGRLVEIVENNLGDFAALEFDHHAHTGLVGFVADVADTFEFLLVDQFGHALQERALVDLIGQLIDDDRLASGGPGPLDIFKVCARTHHDPSTTGPVALANPGQTVDDSRRRKIRRRDLLDQFIDRDIRTFQQQQASIQNLIEVVRRHIRCHAHRDSGTAIDEQVWNPRRQDQGFAFAPVVVRSEIDGFPINVGQQLVSDLAETDLRVAHRSRIVAVDRAKIALTIDQQVAQ